jgi:hypothetical protein
MSSSRNKVSNKSSSKRSKKYGKYGNNKHIDDDMFSMLKMNSHVQKRIFSKIRPIVEYLERKENRGWAIGIGSVTLGVFLISLLWQYVFYFMALNVICKIYLWFLEHYDTHENAIDDSDEVEGPDKRLYMITSNPVNIVEYVIIIISMGIVTPFGRVPYVGMFFNLLLIITSIVTATNSKYRKLLCNSIKNMLVSKKYQREHRNNGYTCSSRNVGRIHESLRNVCGCFDAVNIGTYNIMWNFKSCYDTMSGSNTIMDGLSLMFNELSDNKIISDNVSELSSSDNDKSHNIETVSYDTRDTHDTHDTYDTHNTH